MPACLLPARRRAGHLPAITTASIAASIVLAVATAGWTALPARAATSSLCYLGPATIVGPGGSTTLTGQIMTGGRTSISGVSAKLETWYSGAWHPYTHRTTNSAGKAYFPVTPPRTLALRLRFAGTAAHAPCATGMVMLWVSSDPRVITEAARHNGASYRYGASGPTYFDCSGYTQYVFRRFGRALPRVSRDQYAAMRHVTKSSAVSGDLIFFGSSASSIYHVGIYAGGGYIWHAPGSGQTVKKQRIWTSAYYVGRL